MTKNELIPHILVVDDVDTNLIILGEMIRSIGCNPLTAISVEEALEILKVQKPQLILLDITMPELSGYEFCDYLKKDPLTKEIPIIFVSALDSPQDKAKGFAMGAVDFITKPYEISEVTMRIKTHLKIYRMQFEMEETNRRLHHIVTQQMERLREEQKNILYALAKLVEGKDLKQTNHLQNIGKNCRLLAQSMQFSPQYENVISDSFIETIEVASLLHDLGKISIPDRIVLKPGALTPEEMMVMKEHSKNGALQLKEIYQDVNQNQFIKMAIEIAMYHHERWDGKGYPEGLKGEDIPLPARIMSVVDVYDTLLGSRCYKDSYTKEEAMKIMKGYAGKRFDPSIVKVFEKVAIQFQT